MNSVQHESLECAVIDFVAWQGSEDNSEGAGALHQTLLERGHLRGPEVRLAV